MLVRWALNESSGLFISATLTPQSKALLLERFPPIHSEVHAHHMTMAFDPPVEHYLEHYNTLIGQPLSIKVIGVAEDDKGQAVRVVGPSDNTNPHVTISCAKGVPAKYSNQLLSSGWNPVPTFELEAIIEAIPLNGSSSTGA